MHHDIGMEEMKKIEVQILDEIVQICNRNNIEYYLAYGTLLGAVRHKGFIPWDDDIDISIERKMWEKFVSAYTKEANPRYKLLSIETSTKYCSPLAKVIDSSTVLIEDYYFVEKESLGVYVDVFVLDSIPDDPKARRRYLSEMKTLKRLWLLSDRAWIFKHGMRFKDVIYNIISRPLRLIGPRYFLKKYNRLASKFSQIDTKQVSAVMYGPYGAREIIDRSLFSGGSTVIFEGKEYMAPNDPDAYLTLLYGDYMQLPPEEKRVTHHHYNVKWK